jgi:CO/xanthine dehydrogenase Mo-binding subunit
VGSTDISGVNSSFVLVSAEILGVSPDEVNIVRGDTASNPFAPNSGGSQTTYSVADAVKGAAEEAKKKLLTVAADEFEAAEEDIELVESHAQVKGVPDKRISIYKLAGIAQSKGGGGGPITGEGSAAKPESAPAFVAHLVKVRVDPDTGRVTPLAYVAFQDVGFALNPAMVQGQVLGGIVQGIGMALHEQMVFDGDGQLLTGSFMDYGIPRAEDVPPIDSTLIDNPSPHGPFGARGVGEPPIIPVMAAVANAIEDAVGVRLLKVPMTAEDVWKGIKRKA